MKKDDLEKRLKELEDKMKRIEYPTYPSKEYRDFQLDPECLHNGCGHNRKGGNIACMLFCPHCNPMC